MKKILPAAALFDSSILVPFFDDKHVHYKEALEFFSDFTSQGLTINISSQNVLEVTMVLGRKYKTNAEIVAEALNKFLDDPLVHMVYPNPAVVDRFLKILKDGGGSYYPDIFLAATALEYGFDTIVTNDRDFGKIKGIKVYNPFRS